MDFHKKVCSDMFSVQLEKV